MKVSVLKTVNNIGVFSLFHALKDVLFGKRVTIAAVATEYYFSM